MSKWAKEDDEDKKKGPHPDYHKNLNFSRQYIANSNGKLPKGMRIRIGDSDHEKETIVQITYQDPDFGSKNPSYGGTINLHQPHKAGIDTPVVCFFEEFRNIYLQIYKLAKRYDVDTQAFLEDHKPQASFW